MIKSLVKLFIIFERLKVHEYIPLCPKIFYSEHIYLFNFEKSISNDLVWFRITIHELMNFRFKLKKSCYLAPSYQVASIFTANFIYKGEKKEDNNTFGFHKTR